jgi:hypothetical protein
MGQVIEIDFSPGGSPRWGILHGDRDGSAQSVVSGPGDLTIFYFLFAKICDFAILRFDICWPTRKEIANIKSQIEIIKSPGLLTTDD